MAIAEFNVRSEYVGNGAVSSYTFDFKITSLSHLIVMVTDESYNKIFRVRGTDVTSLSSVVFDPVGGGGTVILPAPLANGYFITILFANDEPLQESEFSNKADFTLKRFEAALDVLAAALQRQVYLNARTMKISDSLSNTETFDPTVPIFTTNNLLQDSRDRVIAVNDTNDGIKLGPTTASIAANAALALASKIAAQAAATAAMASQIAAALSELNAAASAAAALVSENAAAGSAFAANLSQAAALASELTASAAAAAALISETNSAASEIAAALSAANALVSETNAALSAAAALVSETNAAASELAAAASAAAALTSESNAAASAAAASSTVLSSTGRVIVFLTFADSPKSPVPTDNGTLYVCDTTAGPIVINLPALSSTTLPYNLSFKLESGISPITLTANGSDLIDGSPTEEISSTGAGRFIYADGTMSPDQWTAIGFGLSTGNYTINRFSGDAVTTTFPLTIAPNLEENIDVYITGVYQQKDTFSVVGTSLVFSAAPPAGTDNIEVKIGTTLGIGVPSNNTVSTIKIVDSAITTAKLADGSVTTAKLLNGSVTTAKLLDLNVTTAKLADASVTTPKIADDSVTTTKILDLNVTTSKLADASVTTAKLLDNAVTTAKILNDAITSLKILNDAITTAKILDLNVTTSKLADASVTTSKLADASVTTAKIADGSITAAKLDPAAIVIPNYSVSRSKLQAANIAFSDIINFSTFSTEFVDVANSYSSFTALTTDVAFIKLLAAPLGTAVSYIGANSGGTYPAIEYRFLVSTGGAYSVISTVRQSVVGQQSTPYDFNSGNPGTPESVYDVTLPPTGEAYINANAGVTYTFKLQMRTGGPGQAFMVQCRTLVKII